MSRERLYLFDTTLRDGAQTNGVDFTLHDKQLIAGMLDELGIDYVEGGYPGANPTDTEFFAEKPKLETCELHRVRHDAAARPLGLERSGYGGAARSQGGCDLLRRESVGLSGAGGAGDHQRGKSRLDPRQRDGGEGGGPRGAWSTASISSTATRKTPNSRWPAPRRPTIPARAGWCCATPMAAPCRTRSRASSARSSKQIPGDHLGIHAHNDTEQAVANSLAAVRAGARQIQGTLNGLGERCGNANLCSLIPTLKLKPEFADAFEIGVSRRQDGDADEGVARRWTTCSTARRIATRPMSAKARSSPRPAFMPPRSLKDPHDLRACVAGNGRQSPQGAGVRSGRPLQRDRRTRPRRHLRTRRAIRSWRGWSRK